MNKLEKVANAIRARIEGEFDNSNLMEYGPLSTSIDDDVEFIKAGAELKLHDVEMHFPGGETASVQVYDVDFDAVSDRLFDRYPSALFVVAMNE
jgi:hypothetical protein